MKISIIQSSLIWENKPANLSNFEKVIKPLANKSDLIILPETFNTGFSMNPEKLSEKQNGETLDWMKHIASEGNHGICGSYLVNDNGSYYNRWVFVSPEKEIQLYNKRHLFSMGGEGKLLTRGESRLVFTFRGLRISPYVCYDLRFPVWSRSKNDCDLMIYAANWPEARREVWNTLLKARAIENQCYVAGANITGTDGEGINYCGDSAIINPRGEVLASASPNTEAVISADLYLPELTDFRNKFPVFNDADSFEISI
jgi:predicted amidohydrolase